MSKPKTSFTSARIIIYSALCMVILDCSPAEKGPKYETSPPEGQYQLGIYGHSIDLTRDGGFIVGGYIKYLSKKDRDQDLWVMKADRDGNQVWCKTYGGVSTDRAWSVKQLPDGDFLIAGETYSFDKNNQIFLLKLETSGDQVWGKVLGSEEAELAMASIVTSEGSIFVAGSGWSDSLKRSNFYLAEISESGEILSEHAYDHEWSGGAVSMAQLPDHSIVMLGNIQDPESRSVDFGLLHVDQEGKLLNKLKFGSASSDEAGAVISSPDGGYLVVGTEFKDKTNKRDAVVYKFSSSDEIEWQQYFGGKSEDGAVNIVSTSDGGYAVIGYTQSAGAGFRDVYLLKINASGELMWSQTYGGKKTDWAYDLKQTQDGGYLISAGSKSTGKNATDIWIIKVDGSGQKVWDKVYCSDH